MEWSYVIGLAFGALVLVFAALRAERKRLWVVLLVLVLPIGWMAYEWVVFKQLWREALTALVVTVAIATGWWLAVGRKLPPPTSDNITVWGQETGPKPKPQDVAAMQAELLRLKEENQKMEAELQRLRGEE